MLPTHMIIGGDNYNEKNNCHSEVAEKPVK